MPTEADVLHSCEATHTVGLTAGTASDARRLLTGVRDPARLAAVADLDLPGHVGDLDLDGIVETPTAALDVPIAVVNVITPDRQTNPAEVGIGAPCTRVPDGVSFCAEVVETGRPVQVADARTHPAYRDNPLVQQGLITSYAGVPLVHRGGVIGTVSVFDESRGRSPGASSASSRRRRAWPPRCSCCDGPPRTTP